MKTGRQKLSRNAVRHTCLMFAEELPTRMPTYVPTRIELVPAIASPIFFIRDILSMSVHEVPAMSVGLVTTDIKEIELIAM